jgi:Rap1a immunity proteins
MLTVRIAITIALFIDMVRIAAAFSGNNIVEMCRTNPELVAMYAAGVSDAHSDTVWTFELIREKPDLDEHLVEDLKNVETIVAGRYCVPEGATVRQVGDVFCKFLRENPARRQYTASLLFRSAMTEAWPCGK